MKDFILVCPDLSSRSCALILLALSVVTVSVLNIEEYDPSSYSTFTIDEYLLFHGSAKIATDRFSLNSSFSFLNTFSATCSFPASSSYRPCSERPRGLGLF